MCIVIVFMLAYGMGRDVILHADRDIPFGQLLRVFFVPYFHIFGDLFMDYPSEDRKHQQRYFGFAFLLFSEEKSNC